jgi:hypothetical protein
MSVTSESIAAALLDAFEQIRCVAVRDGERVDSHLRSAGTVGELDRHEELFVNAGLLSLARERGAFDGGGLEYVVVAYGDYVQLLLELGERRHAAITFAAGSDPIEHLPAVLSALRHAT